MAQVTLVGFYGPKPAPLANQLTAMHAALLASPLAPYFRPYTLEQIHATIVGLERTDFLGLENASRAASSGERVTMDLACALALARSWPALTIRFGGFKPSDRQLISQGQSPYARSFQLRLAKGRAVMIGWCHRAGDFDTHTVLWTLRRRFGERAGVWPKYDEDSDLFLTLGELALPADAAPAVLEACATLETAVRDQLAASPIDVPLTVANLAFVRYTTLTLDPASSRAWRVVDPYLSADVLARAYEES